MKFESKCNRFHTKLAFENSANLQPFCLGPNLKVCPKLLDAGHTTMASKIISSWVFVISSHWSLHPSTFSKLVVARMETKKNICAMSVLSTSQVPGYYEISWMTLCKTAVSIVLSQYRYCNLALSHRYIVRSFQRLYFQVRHDHATCIQYYHSTVFCMISVHLRDLQARTSYPARV